MFSTLDGVRDRVFSRPRLPRSARQVRRVRGMSVEQAARLSPSWARIEASYIHDDNPWTGRGM